MRRHVWVLLAVASLGGACARKSAEPAEGAAPALLHGTWRAEGQEPEGPDGTRPRSWFLEYTFDDRGYQLQGYPPLAEKGRVTLIDQQGQRFRIRLAPERIIELHLEEDGEGLVIDDFRYQRQRR